MAASTLKRRKISWGSHSPKEKLNLLKQLTISGEPDDFLDILAGIEDIGIATKQLIDICLNASPEIKKLTALRTKSKSIAEAIIPTIQDLDCLIDLVCNGASIHIRKNAVIGIDDIDTLTNLYQRLDGADKTVCKVLKEKLGEASIKQSSIQVMIKPTVNKNEDESSSHTSTNQRVYLNEIVHFKQELKKQSVKKIASLDKLQNDINELEKKIPKKDQDTQQQFQILKNSIKEKFAKNKAFQKTLASNTDDLLVNLQESLEKGNTKNAISIWDKVQENIQNITGNPQTSLINQANSYKKRINELKDWRSFAAEEKKLELINKMQNLINSKMHASDKSKHIRKLHNAWKSLGRSNQNKKLWNKFRKLSNVANEPCKIYYKQRKKVMASNLKARREICNKLEEEIRAMNRENIHITSLDKLLNWCKSGWKNYAPVEQSKFKTLQKHFYNLVAELKRLRKLAIQDNRNQKQIRINKALELIELDNTENAINSAKILQKEWKNIGPTTFKQDKQYWEEFRAACDKIFAKRAEKVARIKNANHHAEKQIKYVLKNLLDISNLSDKNLRQSRDNYNELQQDFASILNLNIQKKHHTYLDEFKTLKLRIDTRFSTLPSKKWENMKITVLEKTQLLAALEADLFASKNNSHFIKIKSKLKDANWNQIKLNGVKILAEILQSRVESILKTPTLEELKNLAKENEQKIRYFCTELEILAGAETPTEDQSLRMQIQLSKLKSGFGKTQPNIKENTKFAKEIELQAHCTGPLEEKTRKELLKRLGQTIKKIL